MSKESSAVIKTAFRPGRPRRGKLHCLLSFNHRSRTIARRSCELSLRSVERSRLLAVLVKRKLQKPGYAAGAGSETAPSPASGRGSVQPIENRLGDPWSISDVLNPGLLGSPKQFLNIANRISESPRESKDNLQTAKARALMEFEQRRLRRGPSLFSLRPLSWPPCQKSFSRRFSWMISSFELRPPFSEPSAFWPQRRLPSSRRETVVIFWALQVTPKAAVQTPSSWPPTVSSGRAPYAGALQH